MRVAYVCADAGVPVFGCKGCSIHVQEMLRAMVGRGFDVELFTPRVDGNCPEGLEPVRVHRLPQLRANREAATTRQVEQENQSRREMIEDAQPFDLVYERYSLWSFVGMAFARQQDIPGILEVNAPLIEEQATYRGLTNRHVAEGVARRAFKAASALVAVSPEVADYLSAWPETEGRTHVVSNGVNVSRFGPLRSRRLGTRMT
ncbi:MAG: glycosyltransferase [Planctomycetaceae bacterium]